MGPWWRGGAPKGRIKQSESWQNRPPALALLGQNGWSVLGGNNVFSLLPGDQCSWRRREQVGRAAALDLGADGSMSMSWRIAAPLTFRFCQAERSLHKAACPKKNLREDSVAGELHRGTRVGATRNLKGGQPHFVYGATLVVFERGTPRKDDRLLISKGKVWCGFFGQGWDGWRAHGGMDRESPLFASKFNPCSATDLKSDVPKQRCLGRDAGAQRRFSAIHWEETLTAGKKKKLLKC